MQSGMNELRRDQPRRDLAVLDPRPKVAFGELAGQMQRLGIDRFEIAGRVDEAHEARPEDGAGDEHDGRKHDERPFQLGLDDLGFTGKGHLSPPDREAGR